LRAGRRWALLYIVAGFALMPLSIGGSLVCRRLGVVYCPPSEKTPAAPERSSGGWLRQRLFAAGVVSAFMALNASLSLLNRWALGIAGGLRLPLLMTASHMVFGSFALTPLMLLHEGYAATLLAEARSRSLSLVLIGAFNALQISLNNTALVSIELSLNQVVRATGPVVVALLAVCLEGSIPRKGEALCLLGISAGAMMTVYSGLGHSTAFGVALTAASTLAQCLQISISGRLMRGQGKLDAFQMTALTGPISFLAIIPFALTAEFSVLSAALATQPATALSFLLGSCVLAVLYNVVLFQALQTLSTVGTSILGNVKIVLLLFLSALFLGELRSWTAVQLFGCALTFATCSLYSQLKLQR